MLQIQVKVEAQRQVIPLGLGDVFRVPTRDEIGNPKFLHLEAWCPRYCEVPLQKELESSEG